MALEQRLSVRLQQRLVMTPALQLAIKLLQLNRLELEATLQQEMVENPVLEEREEPEEQTVADRAEAEEAAENPDEAAAGTEELGDNFDADEFFAKMFDYQPTSPNMRGARRGAAVREHADRLALVGRSPRLAARNDVPGTRSDGSLPGDSGKPGRKRLSPRQL